MEPQNSHQQPLWFSARLLPSLVLIAIGVLYLLSNLHVIYFHDWWRYWPVLLIALGVVKLVDAIDSGGRVTGAILFGVGAILLAQSLGYIYYGIGDLWPLFLIGLGVLMLVKRLSVPRFSSPYDYPQESNTLTAAAVFGGGKRKISTQDFRGGKVDAVFGGFEIDLRDASMAADSATLDINVVFGGVEVRIPESWIAEVRGMGVFGGYGDSTVHPNPAQYPNPKRLIFTGGAVFGGVEVKN